MLTTNNNSWDPHSYYSGRKAIISFKAVQKWISISLKNISVYAKNFRKYIQLGKKKKIILSKEKGWNNIQKWGKIGEKTVREAYKKVEQKDPAMNNYKEPDNTTLSGQYGNRLIWTNKQEKWQWEGPD